MAGLTSLFVTRDGSSNGTTPKGARHALGGLLLQAGDALLNARKGVLVDGGGNLVSGKANMSFDIRAAQFVGQASNSQGPWVGANDATVNVTTTAAPGSNSRIDIICARQHFVAGDGGIDSDVTLEFFVVQGVTAASPVAPATPTGAIKLAEAIITSGMTATNTATITQVHDWTVARGGVLPIDSAAQLATLTPHRGQVIYDDTVDRLKVWDGTNWKLVAPVKSGTVSSGSVAAGGTTDVAVVFTNPYPAGITPNVVVQRFVSSTLPEVMEATVTAVSNTGFTVRFKNTFTGALAWNHMWIAHGDV